MQSNVATIVSCIQAWAPVISQNAAHGTLAEPLMKLAVCCDIFINMFTNYILLYSSNHGHPLKLYYQRMNHSFSGVAMRV